MTSEGPKMVEMSYGLVRNGLKWPKNQEKPDDPRWPPPRVQRVYNDGGRNRLFWLKLERPANGSK